MARKPVQPFDVVTLELSQERSRDRRRCGTVYSDEMEPFFVHTLFLLKPLHVRKIDRPLTGKTSNLVGSSTGHF